MDDFRTLLVTGMDSRPLWAVWKETLPTNFPVKALRVFHPFQFATCEISVQASAVHYCRPQETLDDLTAYTHWEVYLSLKDGAGKSLEDFIRRSPFEEYWGEDVSHNVPTEVAQGLLNLLESLLGKPTIQEVDLTIPLRKGVTKVGLLFDDT